MKVTALVENKTNSEFKAKHGLSLYIETKYHRILFDLGPDKTLFENAKKRNIDLSMIDIVILSHGHIDHAGALEEFLKINSKVKIYVQKEAFEPHYSKILFMNMNIGINKELKNHPQVILLNGDYQIDDELHLLTVHQREKCYSNMNDVLYDQNGKDHFSHEQNLIIVENQVALIMGCGHTGVVNIMEKVDRFHPQVCIGGFHLFNPFTKRTVSSSLLDSISKELQSYQDTYFYTCHCTGKKAYQYLSAKMSNLSYLSCGESIDI